MPFDQATWNALLPRLAANGWVHIASAVTPADRANPEVTVESHFLLNPNSIARHGDTVRVHALSVPARPHGETRSQRSIIDYHCAARTWQLRAVEGYRKADATDPIVGGPVPNAVVGPVVPRSPAAAMLEAVCVGAFAQTGTRSPAPLPLQPVIAGAPVVARASQASGLVVAPQRVLTNAHATTGCTNVDVTVDGKRHAGRVHRRDAAADLALIDVPTLAGAVFPALRSSAALGEPVVAAGFPGSAALGSGLTITSGLVSGLTGPGDNSAYLQISTTIQPGNSGGPLLDAGGDLVGLVSAKLKELVALALTGAQVRDAGYAIKPEIIALFLRTESIVPRTVDRPGQLGTTEVAARAKAFTARVNCTPAS